MFSANELGIWYELLDYVNVLQMCQMASGASHFIINSDKCKP